MAPIPAQLTGTAATGIGDSRPGEHAQRARLAVTGRDVRAALAGLSAEHRLVIVQIYYYHRSVAETAVTLGVRPSAVISLAYSAVCQLPHTLAAVVGCRGSLAAPG
jgi:DNA-directed RNA polymerase specialized sigma24 family protein